jgi:hypothetical protein
MIIVKGIKGGGNCIILGTIPGIYLEGPWKLKKRTSVKNILPLGRVSNR